MKNQIINAKKTTNRRYQPTFHSILMIIFSALMAYGCCEDGTRTEVETLEKAEWVGYLNTVFDGVTLRLNNYTQTRNEYSEDAVDAFFKPDDSYLSIPLLDMDVSLDIPIYRQEPYSFYITNVESASFTPDARRGKALITILFEDQGRKLWGNCIDNAACIAGDVEIELNDMQLDVWLGVGARGGRLIISDIEAEITSTFEETGPCVDNFFAFLCDWLAPDRENLIKESIETQIVSHFNSYRPIIEVLLNDYIQSTGVTGEITNATIANNGNLILTVDYEEPGGVCF